MQYIITLSNGNLSAFDTSGNGVPLGFSSGNVELVRANGLELAMVLENSPTNIQFSRIGSSGSIIINGINASAPEEQDEILAQWDTPVDMENATINDFVFDDEFLAATVNVSATDRLVVYNRSNDQQWLASDAKYAVSDPSLKNGILAWSIRDHLDPTKPLNKYMDGEIQFVNLTNNHTQTADPGSAMAHGNCRRCTGCEAKASTRCVAEPSRTTTSAKDKKEGWRCTECKTGQARGAAAAEATSKSEKEGGDARSAKPG